MSVYLEAVAQAREARDQQASASEAAQDAFVAALVRAREHHSLRAIAPYAALSFAGVKYLTDSKGADDA